MIEIANPQHNVVLKFVLENKQAAETLLSAIIGEEVEVLASKLGDKDECIKNGNHTKYVSHLPGNFLVKDFYFTVKIKGETIKVELLRARFLSDILLSWDMDSINKEPNFTIYLLNRDDNLPDCPLIAVDHGAKDVITGKTIGADNEFIQSLRNKTWILQGERVKKERRNDLEKLLALFENDSYDYKNFHLCVAPDEIPEKYESVMWQLLKANATVLIQNLVDFEFFDLNEYAKVFRKRGEEEAHLKRQLAEQKRQIAEKDKLLQKSPTQLLPAYAHTLSPPHGVE